MIEGEESVMHMQNRTCHMTVCGKGLTEIVRSLYCFEQNKEGAIGILSCLDGISEEQSIKVCVGDAHLTDREDGLVGYVETPDHEFKHKYHTFMLNKEIRARKIKEEEEQDQKEIAESARKNRIDYEDQVWINERNPYSKENDPLGLAQKLSARGREIYEAGIPITLKDGTVLENKTAPSILKASASFDAAMVGVGKELKQSGQETQNTRQLIETFRNFSDSMQEPTLPKPSAETIKVGRWNVPKNYLDRYANFVVKRIRGLIRMQCSGVVSLSAFSPIDTYNLEMERQMLHNAICDSIGVPHSELGKERTQDQADFDEALDKYLDEHSGKLFNGDE